MPDRVKTVLPYAIAAAVLLTAAGGVVRLTRTADAHCVCPCTAKDCCCPRPDPKPDPKPPVVKAAHVRVVIAEETFQRAPAQGKVFFDAALRKWLLDGGHHFALIDQNDEAAVRAYHLPYLPLPKDVTADTLPLVYLSDADKPFDAPPLVPPFKVPATAAELKQAISEVLK